MDNFGRFCPVCKNKNERNTSVCKYCGAQLDEYPTSAAATTKNTDPPSYTSVKNEQLPLSALIPKDGIAVYVAGTAKPVFLCSEKEFVIGRKTEGDAPGETIFDLSESDGFKMGISRRHAAIRQAEARYEVIDLSSTNGTWLNDERLIPNKPYPFVSGSQLRVGRLRFIISYQTVPEAGKKS